MLQYPADFKPDEGAIGITFPDIPEAITFAEDVREAYDQAADCLGVALSGLLELGRPIPEPSERQPGQYLIQVPAWVEELIGKPAAR